MCEGEGDCLKYLKGAGTEKRRRETKILKSGGKLGQGEGALKRGLRKEKKLRKETISDVKVHKT